MLVHGAYSAARRIVSAETYRLEHETRFTDFEEYVTGHEVPLALSKVIEPETLNFLDDQGIVLLGDLRRMSYGELLELPRIGQMRADNAWKVREELWLAWKQAKQAMQEKKKRDHAKMAKRMVSGGKRQMVLFSNS